MLSSVLSGFAEMTENQSAAIRFYPNSGVLLMRPHPMTRASRKPWGCMD
jgi:hypothetical protein